MSAFQNALKNYKAGTPSAPAVNPPEAVKVLEEQSAPEVAGVPEPKPEVAPKAAAKPRTSRKAAAAPATSTTEATGEAAPDVAPVTGDRHTYQLPSVTFEAPGAILNLLDKRAISNAVWDSGITSGTITIKVGL